MDIITEFSKAGVIPVIVIEDAAKAVPLARALVGGGLPILEVTFRTAAAAESIAAISLGMSICCGQCDVQRPQPVQWSARRSSSGTAFA